MSAGLRIELIGHAGSGKTTLAVALLEQLQDRMPGAHLLSVRPAANDTRLLRRLADFRSAKRNTGLTRALLAIAWKTRSIDRDFIACSRELLHRDAATRDSVRATSAEVIDEGVLHALWSLALGLTEVAIDDLRAVLRRLTKPDVVISLRVVPSVALRQLSGRSGGHRLLELSPERALRLLENQERVLDLIEDELGEPRVVRLSPSDGVSMADLADQAARRLAAMAPS